MSDGATVIPDPADVAAILEDPVDEYRLTDVLTTEEEKAVAQKILPNVLAILAAKANGMAEANYTKKIAETLKEYRAEFEKARDAELEKIRQEMKPPSNEDLQKLLNQEYQEFTVKVWERALKTERVFVIRELPQAIELKLFKSIQKNLVPHLKTISGLEFETGTNMAGKLQQVVEIIPEMMELLAENCATCLDPFESDGINKDWVQKNMNSDRIIKVLSAQITANRFRDFFSIASRAIPS